MNNKQLNILVTGASGIVGYGILKNLKKCGNYHLIGSTIYENSVAAKFCDDCLNAPLTMSSKYIPWLVKTIKQYNIQLIIPGIEIDMQVWNENRYILERTGTQILLNSKGLIELCSDKLHFYQALIPYFSEDLIISKTYHEYIDEFPILIKPRRGFGSKGIHIVRCKDELVSTLNKINPQNYIFQEYIQDGDEITASAFFDFDSKLKAICMLKRKLSPLGYTEEATLFHEKTIETKINQMAAILKPIGPTNFQFIFSKKEDRWKLLEVNPRISSSTSIRSCFGYNELALSIDFFINKNEIFQPNLVDGTVVRYVEEYYINDDSSDF